MPAWSPCDASWTYVPIKFYCSTCRTHLRVRPCTEDFQTEDFAMHRGDWLYLVEPHECDGGTLAGKD